MRNSLALLFITIISSCASSQENISPTLVGAPCEGCEAVLEFGDKELNSVDTLPDFNEEGIKIKITGTIYQADGKTPAENVILYIYHTDQNGLYPKRKNETGWGQRHGYLRGWIKTNSKGEYTFYTLQPGTYPERNAAAHIHPTILEPSGKYYWLEDYYFSGDSLLTSRELNPTLPRGGTVGVIKLEADQNIMVGKRDFILGKNVPGYK